MFVTKKEQPNRGWVSGINYNNCKMFSTLCLVDNMSFYVQNMKFYNLNFCNLSVLQCDFSTNCIFFNMSLLQLGSLQHVFLQLDFLHQNVALATQASSIFNRWMVGVPAIYLRTQAKFSGMWSSNNLVEKAFGRCQQLRCRSSFQ
jgi:hypothetical protein